MMNNSRGFVFFFFKQKTAYEILVRSRGLGDVYKRQVLPGQLSLQRNEFGPEAQSLDHGDGPHRPEGPKPVSYTHLTLPTIYSV